MEYKEHRQMNLPAESEDISIGGIEGAFLRGHINPKRDLLRGMSMRVSYFLRRVNEVATRGRCHCGEYLPMCM